MSDPQAQRELRGWGGAIAMGLLNAVPFAFVLGAGPEVLPFVAGAFFLQIAFFVDDGDTAFLAKGWIVEDRLPSESLQNLPNANAKLSPPKDLVCRSMEYKMGMLADFSHGSQ